MMMNINYDKLEEQSNLILKNIETWTKKLENKLYLLKITVIMEVTVFRCVE